MINEKKIKALFMIDNLHGGGAERVLIHILKDLDRDKFEVHLFLIMKEGVYMNEIPSDVPYTGIFRDVKSINSGFTRKIYRLYRRLSLEIFKKMPFLLNFRSGIKEHYDIGISFCEGHNTPLLQLKKNLFSKTISWIHIDIRTHHSVISKRNLRKYTSSLDRLIFVSDDAKNGFIELFPEFEAKNTLQTIYNPIDINGILNGSTLKTIEKRKFTLLSIGRLTKQKRFDRLINVHKRLLEAGIEHEVWILGEGEDRTLLENQIQSLGVSDSCKLLGFQSPYPYLKSADVFVMTSDYEGLPVVVCEAMVLSKPIVSTSVTGPRELLENGRYGLLTETDETSIENGIKAMILDAELRESFRNRLLLNQGKFIFQSDLKTLEKTFLEV